MAEEKTDAELQAEADAIKAEADKKLKEERENETDEERSKRESAEAKEKEHGEALARERARAEKAEKAAADAAFKLRDKRRKEKGEDGEDEDFDDDGDDDKPVTKKDLARIIERSNQKTRKEMQTELIAQGAKKIASNPTEAELIIEIHKNRSFPEGMTLDEQLEEAHIIANGKSIIQRNQELRRALQGKENATNDASGTHRDSPPSQEPKGNPADIRAITAAGYTWDGKLRLYVKTMKGGRVLTYDPKTKARRVVAT